MAVFNLMLRYFSVLCLCFKIVVGKIHLKDAKVYI